MKQQDSKGIQFIEVTRNVVGYKLNALGVFRIGPASLLPMFTRLPIVLDLDLSATIP